VIIPYNHRHTPIIINKLLYTGFAIDCYYEECPIETPNLDRLANEGIHFANGLVTTPICLVSRAFLLTGRYESYHPSENLASTVKLGDKPINGKYKATILTGDSPDSFNDIEHPNRGAPKEG